MLVVCIYRGVVEGSGVDSPGCVVHVCVWRLLWIACNVVATEHGRYSMSCTYVETVERMSSAGCV